MFATAEYVLLLAAVGAVVTLSAVAASRGSVAEGVVTAVIPLLWIGTVMHIARTGRLSTPGTGPLLIVLVAVFGTLTFLVSRKVITKEIPPGLFGLQLARVSALFLVVAWQGDVLEPGYAIPVAAVEVSIALWSVLAIGGGSRTNTLVFAGVASAVVALVAAGVSGQWGFFLLSYPTVLVPGFILPFAAIGLLLTLRSKPL